MNPAISRILVPLDFSAHSDAALRYATALASHLGASMDLLHVVEDPVTALAWSSALDLPDLSELRDSLVEEATRHLERCRTVAEGPSMQMLTVRVGRPTEVITEYAKAFAVDLVVMGTHGTSGHAGVLMGHVAACVVRHAPCPVLTLHADAIGGTSESPRAALPVTLRSVLGRFGTSRE
jgi:nucleotide-binding universal stress UspA family protein